MEWIGRGDKKSVDDINLPSLSARVSWHGDASIQNLVLDVLFAVAGPAATGRERKSQSDRVPTDRPTDGGGGIVARVEDVIADDC